MAGKRGLEPPITRLTAEGSAIELLAINVGKPAIGIEPTTVGLQNRYSTI